MAKEQVRVKFLSNGYEGVMDKEIARRYKEKGKIQVLGAVEVSESTSEEVETGKTSKK